MTTINRVSIRRGVVCRAFTSALLLLSALFAGSSPLHAAKKSEPADKDRVPEGVSASDWQSIRAAHEAWQHAIEAVKGGWQARNPAQQWTTKFDGRGFEAKPQSADWTWGLELRSYGAGDEQREVNGTPEVKAEDHRLAYRWDDTVQEWFVNDGRGLEHGFSVQERPPGPSDAPLTFLLATRGPLRAAVTGDARAVDYRDESGETVLTYSGLRVWDADGRELEARFAPAKDGVTLQVDAKDARYPLLIDPIAEQAYVKASNTGKDDYFGTSVAISGDTVIVGAPYEDSSSTGVNSAPNELASDAGAAYVFVRNAQGIWSQEAYLKASNTGKDDEFGTSVAISGDTVIVGAPYEDSSSTGVNSAPNELASGAGAAYVFVRSAQGIWNQQAYLKASNAGQFDFFGSSVAISGHTMIVGASEEDSSSTQINVGQADNSAEDAGAAYVFVRNAQGIWNQQAYLKVSNTELYDNFGTSVAISGDAVIVGAPYEDSSSTGVNNPYNGNAESAGAAYVFVRNAQGIWNQQAYLKVSNTEEYDYFGTSVAISGDTVIVGAPYEDSSSTGVNSAPNELASDAGAAYVFVRNAQGIWNQQAYLKASNAGQSDEFGTSVAISGDTVIVGAPDEESSSTGVNSAPNDDWSYSGAAYVFVRNAQGTWSEQAYLKASNPNFGEYDEFGESVAISGDTAVVGAYHEDSNTTGINTFPNDGGYNSGAAYIFTGLGPAPVITSASTTGGQVGSAFNYQITASGATPDSYGASGLPGGLTLNPATGLITGTPELEGIFPVTLTATNAGGTGTAAIALEIAADADSLKMLPPKRTVTAGKPAKLVLLFGNNLTRTQKVKVNFSSSNPGLLAAPASFSFDALGKKNAKAKAKAQRRTITIPIPAATAAGTVKITATVGDQSASCDLTIKAAK